MIPIKTSRRKFLRNLFMAVFGIPAYNKTSIGNGIHTLKHNPRKSEIKAYKTLGRTGFRVSDIALGAPQSESVLKALFNAGVNLVDTGHTYGNGNNERMIGRVLKDYDRKKIFINTKLFAVDSFQSTEDVVCRTREALERLQTDYVDCVMIHGADNSKIVKDEAFHAGMEQPSMIKY